MVVRNFGDKAFEKITSALKLFSEAFRNFPFDLEVLYNSPHNIGPANLLYPQKTNYKATMVGIPYDDLQGWLGPYPAATYCAGLQKLCKIWRQGLDELKLASSEIASEFRANYKTDALIAPGVAYIQAHFAEQDFSLSHAISLSHISAAYFRRRFFKLYEMSPLRFVNECRINRAKELLKSGLAASEIARKIGFTNEKYFYAVFRKYVGLTPSEWKCIR